MKVNLNDILQYIQTQFKGAEGNAMGAQGPLQGQPGQNPLENFMNGLQGLIMNAQMQQNGQAPQMAETFSGPNVKDGHKKASKTPASRVSS